MAFKKLRFESLVTVEEAAQTLAVSSKTIRNWIDSGLLPALEVGPKLIRLREEDLAAFCVPTSPESSITDGDENQSDPGASVANITDQISDHLSNNGPTSGREEEK